MAAPISSLSALPTASQPAAGKPKDAAEAAKEFEAMLIAQMLHSAREEAGDKGLSGGDSAGSTMLDMADQEVLQALGRQGRSSLGAFIAKNLKAWACGGARCSASEWPCAATPRKQARHIILGMRPLAPGGGISSSGRQRLRRSLAGRDPEPQG